MAFRPFANLNHINSTHSILTYRVPHVNPNSRPLFPPSRHACLHWLAPLTSSATSCHQETRDTTLYTTPISASVSSPYSPQTPAHSRRCRLRPPPSLGCVARADTRYRVVPMRLPSRLQPRMDGWTGGSRSGHDGECGSPPTGRRRADRQSEEHTSELQ